MLTILEYWDQKYGPHDSHNPGQLYLLLLLCLLLCKLCLGLVVLHASQLRHHQRHSSSFLSTCALSFMVADALLAVSVATSWFLGPGRSPVSVCFVLGHASAVYAALPLPTVGLGLLLDLRAPSGDDMLTSRWSPLYRPICNVVMVLLMWTLAVVAHNINTTATGVMEVVDRGGATVLVCEVHEARAASYITFGLFLYVLLTLLPHHDRLYGWFQEAEKWNRQRTTEPRQQNPGSDLWFGSSSVVAMTKETESGEDSVPTEEEPQVVGHRCPFLWVSLTLGFASVWMPYLVICVMCDVMCGFGIPSYVMVNLLWLECVNSMLTGVAFWLKSNDEAAQHDKLPDDVCLCRRYWRLSKGTHQLTLPTTV